MTMPVLRQKKKCGKGMAMRYMTIAGGRRWAVSPGKPSGLWLKTGYQTLENSAGPGWSRLTWISLLTCAGKRTAEKSLSLVFHVLLKQPSLSKS